MRFLPVNLRSVLVELATLDETLALHAALLQDPFAGVAEIVPAARTLLVRFMPGPPPDWAAFAAHARACDLSAKVDVSDRLVEIPVRYDGADLADVARLTGLSPRDIIARHTGSHYRVAFTGFAPGFGYLVGGDPALAVARRQSPRTRIPAGAVALAGAFSGVYPQEGPGGWQLIGRTPLTMFDLSREPAALLQPGTQVRFVALADDAAFDRLQAAQARPSASRPKPCLPPVGEAGSGTVFTIIAAPLPALFQDMGRAGQAGQGISASGALDRAALRAANRIVGNPPGTPVLEIAGGGFAFECHGPAILALAGTDAKLDIHTRRGHRTRHAAYQPVALETGDRVAVVAPRHGLRTCLAVRGGLRVAPVLGSASVDTLARIGPPMVMAGHTLHVVPPPPGGLPVALGETAPELLPAPGAVVVLDIVMGPRTEWFTAAAVALLAGQAFAVTPQSNRVGLRLKGQSPLARLDPKDELPSEGTANGAIQVPHDGQPILFLADHPLTGGYPVIATLAEYHLDRAAQVPVGAFIRFNIIRPFAEIAPPTP